MYPASAPAWLAAVLASLLALGCAPAPRRDNPVTAGENGGESGGESTSNGATGGASGGPTGGGSGGSSSKPDAKPANPLAPGKSMTCDTPPLAVPTQHIEAECAFGPTTGACAG